MPYTIGLDWGGTTHAVCVMDGNGAVAQRFEELRRKLAE